MYATPFDLTGPLPAGIDERLSLGGKELAGLAWPGGHPLNYRFWAMKNTLP
jgi:hypothetical protein